MISTVFVIAIWGVRHIFDISLETISNFAPWSAAHKTGFHDICFLYEINLGGIYFLSGSS